VLEDGTLRDPRTMINPASALSVGSKPMQSKGGHSCHFFRRRGPGAFAPRCSRAPYRNPILIVYSNNQARLLRAS